MHGRARIVWNHCAGFDSGILLCSVDTKQASADPPESGTGNCAGVGVAMDNAIPAVKEAANFVTKSNLEDGVAWAIEKYVLA